MIPSGCGSCSLCCRLVEIAELQKPPDRWCDHASRPTPDSGGCQIYANRPEACRSFKCLWLNDENRRPELRPDRVHIVFAPGFVSFSDGRTEESISAHVDPGYPDAWKQQPIAPVIDKIVANGTIIAVRVGKKSTLLRRGHRPEVVYGRSSNH